MRISCWFKNAVLSHPTQKEAYQWILLASVNTSDYAAFSFYLSFYPSTCSWEMLSQHCWLLWEPAMAYRDTNPFCLSFIISRFKSCVESLFQKGTFLTRNSCRTSGKLQLSLESPRGSLKYLIVPLHPQAATAGPEQKPWCCHCLGRLLWPFGLTRCQRPSSKAAAEHRVLDSVTWDIV